MPKAIENAFGKMELGEPGTLQTSEQNPRHRDKLGTDGFSLKTLW